MPLTEATHCGHVARVAQASQDDDVLRARVPHRLEQRGHAGDGVASSRCPARTCRRWLQQPQSVMNGSLKRSKMTAPLPANVVGDLRPEGGGVVGVGHRAWLLASVVPGAVQCRSRMTTIPFCVSRFTQPAMAFW